MRAPPCRAMPPSDRPPPSARALPAKTLSAPRRTGAIRCSSSTIRQANSGRLRAGRGDVDRIELVRAGDEEPVPLRPAEDEVRDALREVDAAEQVAALARRRRCRRRRVVQTLPSVSTRKPSGKPCFRTKLRLAALQCVVLADLEGADVARLFRLVARRRSRRRRASIRPARRRGRSACRNRRRPP